MRSLGACPPPPRPFRLGIVDAPTKILLLLGAIWTFVGCLLTLVFAFAGGPLQGDRTLDRRGVATRATPVSLERTSSRVNGRRVYRITYSFKDRAGAPRTASVGSSDEAVIEHARRHTPLDIEYDPQDPSLTRIQGASASVFGPPFVPLGFSIAGGVILALGVWRARRVRAIYKYGEAVRATVTAVSPTVMRLNRRRVMRVDYAFDTPAARVTGRATTVEPLAVGSEIWVIHAPEEPHRNVAIFGDARAH